uniref:Cytohesin-related guanine nucleotide-exchange protein n=1 Tax=Schistosoma mansoni TaxID=6183 RepID=A0A5K4EC52_SCHMA
MNSETRTTKSKGSMFTKVLDVKLRRKYFSSFNSPNKQQYSSFENDNLNDDDVQRHSSKTFEIPLKNERHPNDVTATVRKLNRKYLSSHSHSFDTSRKVHTLISDYRRHTLNAKNSTPYSEDRMRIIKGSVCTIFELTSKSQESNTPGKFLSHDVNHTSSCDHRDSEDETNEKVIVLKNNNIEDYKINEVKAVNKNPFGSEKCVSEGDESWFIIPPTGIDGPCSQNQNSTYSSISSIVSDFTSMSHSVGKSTGSHKSLMNTFYTPTMKRRNRLPIPSEFLNSTSSGPVIYKPTTRSSMTNMYSELNKSSDQDSGLSSQLSSTFRSTDVETQSRDMREHRNLVGSSASWATTLRQSMKRANNKRTLLAGCTLFNRNPVEGVNYLIRNYILLSDPIKIAQFLIHEPNLNRQAIGEYFGLLDNTLAMKVLKEFLLLINMKNMEVDVALRSVIGHFHPSGESQKIANLMKIFHEVYIIQNPDRVRKNFHSPETVEVLAYSVLLLHTDLHNPNVGKMGKRMTKQGFINNNRGIDSDHDVSTDLLEGIYDRIAASEFKTLPDPSDKLRALDGVLIGPLKTDNFVQRHRRFIGRILTQEIEKIAPRKLPGRNNARWRHLLIFNDILVVVKSLNTTRLRSGSLINSVAVVAFGDQNGTRHYTPRNSVSRDDSSCSPFGPVQDVTQKVFCSTEPFATDTTFQVRSVYPFLDLRVLVFESNYYRYGVQLCNSNGPVISLNMPSEACRRQFIDWAYGSIAEMEELQQHQQVKKSECERTIIVNCKRSPTKTTANGTISIINGDRCVMPSSRVTEKVILFNT